MSAMCNPHGNVTHHFRTKLKAYKMKTSNPLNLVLFLKKKKMFIHLRLVHIIICICNLHNHYLNFICLCLGQNVTKPQFNFDYDLYYYFVHLSRRWFVTSILISECFICLKLVFNAFWSRGRSEKHLINEKQPYFSVINMTCEITSLFSVGWN